jgi:hypothetical protein
MSFFGGEILEAVARVVWRDSHRGTAGEPTGIPHGVEFTDIQGAHLDNLRSILQSGAFGAKNTH